MKDALCSKLLPKRKPGDPEIEDPWFPSRGQTTLGNEAKKACMRCPVFDKCDDYKRRVDPEYGIWAGDHKTRETDDS